MHALNAKEFGLLVLVYTPFLGQLSVGCTASFYKMLDIMCKHGNSSTKELSVSMKTQLETPVVEQPTVVSVSRSQPLHAVNSFSSNNSTKTGNDASKCLCVCV